MEGHLLLYTDSVQAQFHLFDFQKCNFRWFLWCDINTPVNAPFLQNTSCLFITYTGSHCGIHPSLRMAGPWQALLASPVSWLWYKLSLTLMPGTLSHHLSCACGRAHVRHVSTSSVVQRNLVWMEQSAGTGFWWNWGSAHSCELMKPRTQKSSCLKPVQLLAGLFWKFKRGQICSKRWVLCVVVVPVSLSHVICTLCCTHVPPIILHHIVKDNLLHMK